MVDVCAKDVHQSICYSYCPCPVVYSDCVCACSYCPYLVVYSDCVCACSYCPCPVVYSDCVCVHVATVPAW